jgi:hypothetical protein
MTADQDQPTSPADAAMARLARSVADALTAFAYSRSADDLKALAVLQTELCAARRAERELENGETRS